ncbi:hypothetical protein A0H81_13483 [Grifola frondosa]|uniref:Uncharacterized protein n=1 Tax=Grifola frondosa TaxID=5627 RepID=A0A1C7LPV2_GRIFR|nr:hypothetical protein A0H81_13483 [Grifola frondosa]
MGISHGDDVQKSLRRELGDLPKWDIIAEAIGAELCSSSVGGKLVCYIRSPPNSCSLAAPASDWCPRTAPVCAAAPRVPRVKQRQKDKSELGSGARRESLKRRRPPSPESPRPYRAFESRDASLFPPTEDGLVPVRLDGLGAYLTEYNKSHPMKLRIWSPARHQKLACPVVARFTIPDVVTVYLTLDHSSDDPALVVESATAFGPREKVRRVTQNSVYCDDFIYTPETTPLAVRFHRLPTTLQQLAKMMQSQAQVPLQSFLGAIHGGPVPPWREFGGNGRKLRPPAGKRDM